MTLGISSFVHSSFSSISDAHSFMTKLKDAILASSANWELSTAVRGVNGITENNSSRIKTTFSVHNTVTGEYVRFWYGSGTFEYPVTDTANTENNNFQISRKNIEIVGASSNKDYPQQTFLFCGVSDSSLGEDPGVELSLKTPIFSFSGKIIASHSSFSSFINTYSSYRYKWVITSDGSGFTIICHSNSSVTNNATGIVYHPNLFITRTGDTHTAGSFSLYNSDQGINFYSSAINGGQLTYYNSLGSADYEHNKSWVSMTNVCQTSASATSIPCMPIACYTYPPTYEGSDSVLVKDGIGFKGYTNMTVIRTTYPSLVTIGVAYANSSWLCIGEGFLIPWLPEHDADSPFVLE